MWTCLGVWVRDERQGTGGIKGDYDLGGGVDGGEMVYLYGLVGGDVGEGQLNELPFKKCGGLCVATTVV